MLKPLAVVCVPHTVYALDYKGGTVWGGERRECFVFVYVTLPLWMGLRTADEKTGNWFTWVFITF